MTDSKQPKVTLVGAGPGDPDLLTLQAVKALQAASVVLVDDFSVVVVTSVVVGDGVLSVLLRITSSSVTVSVGRR